MLPNNIFSTIVNLLVTAWNGVYSWFSSMLNATHARPYILGIIFTMLVVRFTVYPFFKSRVISNFGSDRAKDREVIDAEYRRLE